MESKKTQNDQETNAMPIVSSTGISEMIKETASTWPDSTSLISKNGDCWNFSELNSGVIKVGTILRDTGATPHTRVAVVGESTPETAVAVLGCLAHAIAAPINPASTEEVFQRELQRLNIAMVVSTSSILSLQHAINHLEICLLYTSPSPRDATLSRMPSSA